MVKRVLQLDNKLSLVLKKLEELVRLLCLKEQTMASLMKEHGKVALNLLLENQLIHYIGL
jgi:hypothetical protein